MDIQKVQQTEVLNPRVVLEIFKQERIKALERRTVGGTFGSGRNNRNDRETMTLDTTFTRPFDAPTGRDAGGGLDYIKKIAKEMDAKDKIKLRRFDFVIQFAWVETPPSIREKKRETGRLAQSTRQRNQIGTSPVSEGETPEPPTVSEPLETTPTTPDEPAITPPEPSETPTTEPETTSETPAPPI